ncbi:MAG: hypothetical protein DM484_19940 [Candidatus Methylumidiphilus alinenensis]|uniref:Uncharacterized protein n=1 Tax=Candidatus Methylumidiphilus alinenensis TaxID=2202197 RepID=A0A2W4QY68_9GAMM|nr:MAG: hypothetical protein DM484_19940 [Candidatus Methylumidiphilus alinenensis]
MLTPISILEGAFAFAFRCLRRSGLRCLPLGLGRRSRPGVFAFFAVRGFLRKARNGRVTDKKKDK